MNRIESRRVTRISAGLPSWLMLLCLCAGGLLAGCSSGSASSGGSGGGSTPPPSISVSISPAPPSSLQVGAGASLTAVVANDSSNSGVKWSVTCGTTGSCGSFSSTSTASGTATTYTAPNSVPSGNSVTVTATSVADSSASGSATIKITQSGGTSSGLPNGTYDFAMTGSYSGGAETDSTVGVFYASNGAIAGGELDDSYPGSYAHVAITGGSYSVTADQNVEITLTTSDTGLGVDGTETLEATMISSTSAQLIEYDTFAARVGTLSLQSSTTSPSGGYAFAVGGRDNSDAFLPTVMGGVLNVDSPGAISGNGSVFDFNDGGTLSADASFAASTVTTPDTWGRFKFELVPSKASSVAAITLVGYIVDNQHIYLVETADGFLGSLAGIAYSQGANAGNFSTSSVSGSNYVFAVAIPNRPLQVAGLVQIGTGGDAGGTLTLNYSGTHSPQGGNTYNGTYTVDPSGRVTFTGLSDGSATPKFSYDVEAYFDGNGHALLVSMDADDELFGEAYEQSGSFSAASFSGDYAMSIDSRSESHETVGAGIVTADGKGSLTGSLDVNEDGTSTASLPVTGTFTSASNGVFTGALTGLNPSSPTTAADFTFYLVDNSHVIAIETDGAQVILGDLELQSQ